MQKTFDMKKNDVNVQRDKGHPYVFLWISLLTIFSFFLISEVRALLLLFSIYSLFCFSYGRLAFNKWLLIGLYVSAFSVLFFLPMLLFPKESLKNLGKIDLIIYQKFYFIRIILLSWSSILAGQVIDHTKLLLWLMSEKKISVYWGHALLMALNSIKLFQQEFQRIRLIAQMRGFNYFQRFFIFFPLLVFAIRRAQDNSLSLMTRGLNSKKFFIYKCKLKLYDYFCSLLYCIFLGLIIYSGK